MEYPLVSILVPIYGVEQYIEHCAVCLFEQTYSNIEYIFIDDCTQDNSIGILLNIILHYPSREQNIKIIHHEKNKGLAGARNTAVAAASGEFVLHVDSDDYIEKNCVELLVAKQMETSADIVSGGIVCHKGNKEILWIPPRIDTSHEYCLKLIKRVTPVNIWGRLIKRNLYIENNLRTDEGTNMGEDYQIIPRLVYYANKVSIVDNPLYHYIYANSGAYTNGFSEEKDNQVWKSFKVLYDFFENKGEKYVDALNQGKIELLIGSIISSVNAGNYYYYRILREMLDCCNNNNMPNLPLTKKIIVYISDYRILRVYLKMAMEIKRLIG